MWFCFHFLPCVPHVCSVCLLRFTLLALVVWFVLLDCGVWCRMCPCFLRQCDFLLCFSCLSCSLVFFTRLEGVPDIPTPLPSFSSCSLAAVIVAFFAAEQDLIIIVACHFTSFQTLQFRVLFFSCAVLLPPLLLCFCVNCVCLALLYISVPIRLLHCMPLQFFPFHSIPCFLLFSSFRFVLS